MRTIQEHPREKGLTDAPEQVAIKANANILEVKTKNALAVKNGKN